MSKDIILMNEAIRSPIVTLILANGDKKGQFAKSAAIQLARNEGLDLVQVAPGNPPICKIMDYGKLKFDKSKSDKKKQHAPSLKEIKFGLDIAQHDLDVKIRKITELVEKGHKVQVVEELYGRQKYSQTHKDAARDKMKSLVEGLGTIVTHSPIKEGDGKVITTLSPV